MSEASIDNVCEFERRWKALLVGEFSSALLNYNEHKGSYCKLEDDVLDRPEWFRDDNWTSPEDRKLAIETNTVWSLQWYPNTPVGFYKMHASSLSVLYDWLVKYQDEENGKAS